MCPGFNCCQHVVATFLGRYWPRRSAKLRKHHLRWTDEPVIVERQGMPWADPSKEKDRAEGHSLQALGLEEVCSVQEPSAHFLCCL